MEANGRATGPMVDVRTVLSVLWITGMLSSLNGDTYRLSDPETLKSMTANTGAMVVSRGLLLLMSTVFVGHILMGVLTLILRPEVSRWANRIVGILYAVIILGFWVLGFVLKSASYEFVWSTAQLVLALLVVWYAWKWRRQEA
jgi:hypothetical protein